MTAIFHLPEFIDAWINVAQILELNSALLKLECTFQNEDWWIRFCIAETFSSINL